MKTVAYAIALMGALGTLGIGLDAMSRPYSLAAFGFIAWAVSPYGCLILLIRWARTSAAQVATVILAILAALSGLGAMIDAMYIHLDAQSALVFLFVPLWQWLGLAVLAVPVLLLNRLGMRKHPPATEWEQ